VSPRTVVNHLEHIKTKLDVHTRTEIAAWATRQHSRPGRAGAVGGTAGYGEDGEPVVVVPR
jgi:hypothetical protein